MNSNLQQNKGFSMIELLAAVSVIGMLAAIAIPRIAQDRRNEFNLRARAELRNILTAEDAYYASTGTYTNQIARLPGVTETDPGVVIDIQQSSDNPQTIGISAYHKMGDKTYCYTNDVDRNIREKEGALTGKACIH